MKDTETSSPMRIGQTVAVVVLAAALGVTASLLMDARRRVGALEAQLRGAPASPPSDGTDRVAATDTPASAELAALRARVDALEQQLGVVRANPAARTQVEDAAEGMQRDLEKLPPVAAGSGSPDERRAALQQLVKQELADAERARDDERSARMRARVTEKLDALEKSARLRGDQKQRLTDMLDAEQQQIRQLFRDARDSGDFATVREQIRTLRTETDDNARAILDADQQRAYETMRQEEVNRFLLGNAPREER